MGNVVAFRQKLPVSPSSPRIGVRHAPTWSEARNAYALEENVEIGSDPFDAPELVLGLTLDGRPVGFIKQYMQSGMQPMPAVVIQLDYPAKVESPSCGILPIYRIVLLYEGENAVAWTYL